MMVRSAPPKVHERLAFSRLGTAVGAGHSLLAVLCKVSSALFQKFLCSSCSYVGILKVSVW